MPGQSDSDVVVHSASPDAVSARQQCCAQRHCRALTHRLWVTSRHLAVDSVCTARQSAVHHHLRLQLQARGPASVLIAQHWRFGRGAASRNKACSALRSQMCRVFLRDRNKPVMLLKNDGVRALHARRREQACPIHWRRCEPLVKIPCASQISSIC